MLSFIFSNILIISSLYIPGPTNCGITRELAFNAIEKGQTLVASNYQQIVDRGPAIYTPSFIWPVDHTKTGEGFGVPRPETDSIHMGFDIFPGEGALILASTSGYVTKVEHDTGSYGYAVEIYDGYQYSTLYAHMIAGSFEKYGISVGTQVKQGQVIGLVGNTGRSTNAHLHFEIRDSGVQVDPESIMAKYAVG